MIKLTYSQLEKDLGMWQKASGADINSVLPDALEIGANPDGSMRFTVAADAPEGGGLIAYTVPFPAAGTSLPYVGLDFDHMIEADDIPYLGRMEQDMIMVANDQSQSANPAPNWVPGSSQRNFSEAGAWQIDPAWTETGFAGSALAPGVWAHVALRGLVDWTNLDFSMLSIVDGASVFQVPAALQKVPFKPEKWAAVIALQLQMEVLIPGAVNMNYRNVTFAMADGAF